ncbi:MAG: hypothetical protein LBP96_03275 [Bacteroidales bacterium]|nr:hypothetical protein [Bacteroidales bacterium]
MKLATVLKVSLLLIVLGLLASCASSNQPAYRSSVPDHCQFQPHKKVSSKKKVDAPPSRVTPIGGNYSVRH